MCCLGAFVYSFRDHCTYPEWWAVDRLRGCVFAYVCEVSAHGGYGHPDVRSDLHGCVSEWVVTYVMMRSRVRTSCVRSRAHQTSIGILRSEENSPSWTLMQAQSLSRPKVQVVSKYLRVPKASKISPSSTST